MGPFCLEFLGESFFLCIALMLGTGFLYEMLAYFLGGGMWASAK